MSPIYKSVPRFQMAENGAESIDMVMRELQCDERLKELLTAMSCVSVEDRLSAKDTLVRVKGW